MFIEVPDESALEADVADWYERQRNAWGYLPNYAPAFALRPDVAEAWNTLNGAMRAHGPPAFRDRDDRRGPRVPVDVLHGGALQVPPRRLRR